MRSATIAALLVACTGLARAGVVATNTEAPGPGMAASGAITINLDTPAGDGQDAADKATLNQAARLIEAGQPQAAIDALAPLVAALEKRHGDSKQQLFCAHSQAEALLYMALAAAAKHDATALDGDFCDAYFVRGFAEIDLGRADAAEADYTRALALAPNNPHYLSEMGELHSSRHDWDGALAFFQRARDAAPAFSERGKDKAELARALRGIGYVDVELGKLDEAEALYRRCLEIDAGDQKAQGELGYVLQLKARQAGQSR